MFMSHRSSSRGRLPVLWLVLAALIALALPASAAAAVTPGTAAAIAGAIASPSANVTGAAFVSVTGGTPNGTGDSALTAFPIDGGTYGILTSGNVASVDDPGTFASTSNGGGAVRGDTDRDVSILRIDLNVQAGANCLSFNFQFLSEEHPIYVGSQYNDAFIAEMDSSTWTTSGSTITAPNNFAFDGTGDVVSINSTGVGGMTAAEGAGTAYDSGPGDTSHGAATQLLSASTPVTPGAHSLFLSIFDQGDQIFDSAVFLDNLTVGFVPNPTQNCKAGATPVNFLLTLTPGSAQNPVGTSHTVTATLTDEDGAPVSGALIEFTVSGANATTGTGTTNASGVATFTYNGTAAGLDSISACYDPDNADPCEAVASADKEWTDVNDPPTADAGGPYVGDEGSAVAISGSASDPDGDSLTTTWSYAAVSGVDAGATCAFGNANALSTTVTCTDDGVWALTLTADDGNHPPVDSAPATLTLGNVNPDVSITTPTEGQLYAIGTPIALSAPFTDAGKNDSHTCTIDWDDGAGPVAGTVTEVAGSGSGTCSASKTFPGAGVYTIRVVLSDDDGGSDTATVMIVVYDPSAGFVTGGGWINSPAGAYTADPSLSGRANFGFVSKYKKGATAPTGQTEFQFHAGSFNFHSDAYQWLVVAGHRAQYKGTGSVNGVSGYGFLLTAYDGQLPGGGTDRFRIKIWEVSTGNVVYDNNLGASDDIDAAAPMALEGGQIVIHK